MKGWVLVSWKARLALVGFLLMSGSLGTASAQTGERYFEGTVLDQQALPIPGAQIVVTQQQGNLRKTTVTSTNRFRIDGLVPGVYDVRIEAPGFAPKVETVDLRTVANATLEIRLEPGRLSEQVIVTPTRSEQELANVPQSVTVLHEEEIRRSPAVMADDILRQIPTFSLFRRASSISLHPTSQGVSLRGMGPSGQSRTLVLIDGVPFNDPFGGWVYWTRVPLVSVDRIEVVDGSSSSLYGNYAMGGVINIVTSPPTRRTVEIKPQYGNRGTGKFDFFASDRWKNKLGVAVEGSFFNTDGYPIVSTVERGPIDINAKVNYKNVSTKVEYTPTDRVSAFFRGGYFTEDRVNGKVGEVNDTTWTTVSGGVRVLLPDASDLQARVFGDHENFHSTFLAVTNSTTTRNIVRLSTDQQVPTNGVGGIVQWSKALGGAHVFGAGTDWRWVDGDSHEDNFAAATPAIIIPPVTAPAVMTVQRVGGGTQRSIGAFVQDVFTPLPKLVITGSARLDSWRNYDSHNLETTVATGLPTVNNKPSLPDKESTVVSPRIAALYHVSDRVSGWGAWSSGFRAPTLTELYRQFSVAGVTTRPNEQLGPERLKGGEAGINIAPTRDVTVRATWFDNRLKDPVSNVTIGTNLVQKQNLGGTRIRGVQSDVEYRLGSTWRFSGGYVYSEAKVTDGGAANAGLVGKFLPQVPKHRGSVQVAYANPRYVTIAAGVQMLGRQFDDDLNVRTVGAAALAEAGYGVSTDPGLPEYALVDLMASRAIGKGLEVFFGVQNLFDQTYFVQTNPSSLGTPRLVSGGVRVRIVGR